MEEHVIPYIDVSSGGQTLNAYIYDFYKHGDVTSLQRANRIRRSDVWFKLNDFSMVLATIIASMKNFMGTKTVSVIVGKPCMRRSREVLPQVCTQGRVCSNAKTSVIALR